MKTENEIAKIVFDCALKVHKQLGPGLLESAYEECLFYELKKTELKVEKQKPLPLIYEDVKLDVGYRIDIFIEKKFVIEVKAVESLHDVHLAQVLTYLKLSAFVVKTEQTNASTTTMYQLEEKTYFTYFIAVAILLVAYFLVFLWKKRKQKQFANLDLLNKLSPNRSVFKSILKIFLITLALSFMIIALVNPKMGTKLKTIKREGVDIVFALDVSKSMLCEDIAPSRLAKAKQIISKTIDKLGSDRVGIIIYAGNAYPLLPITTDQAAAKMFLQNASPNMVSSQGTAINEALLLAKTYYDNEEQTNRFLVLISDGEDHSDNGNIIIDDLVKEGIKTYTIGVGTTKGGPIKMKMGNSFLGYKKDRKGEVVITKMNDEILKKIANNGNGKYIYGNNTQATVDTISEILINAQKKEFETKQFSDYKDQFQWFIALGLLFLILDLFMFDKKTKWIQKMNLFNEKK